VGLVARPVAQRPLAILAYGSLLHSPGSLGPLITGVVPCRTPFPVEYGRASQRWNGGPVLVPHPDGGPVDGALLLLAGHLELGQAADLLAEREGLLTSRGILQVEVPGEEERLVLTCSLPRNLPAPDITPAALARRAVASVHRDGRRNGVRYLAGALAQGVVTPRTEAYRDAVLAAAGAGSLDEAERVLALPRSEGGEGAADGLG
jgi:hypothetical protein